MSDVGAVILAAGRGERLSRESIAAPHHKPLLPVNGRPLVRTAVLLAHEVAGVRKPIVVVAPENAWAISHVLEGLPATLVVQRTASGVADALLMGLELTQTRSTLALMADNVLTGVDVAAVVAAEAPAVGVRSIPYTDASRFTYLRPDNLEWVEKANVPQHVSATSLMCWVGPLYLNTSQAEKVLRQSISNGSQEIGPPLLNDANNDLTIVPVSTYDIGTPDAWVGDDKQ